MFVYYLHWCFIQFSSATGLRANLGKNSLYCGGVIHEEKDNLLRLLGYTYGELPFNYLGIPLSTKKLTTTQWQPLVQKIVNRISSWTARKLSYAGCRQLVKSVTFGIQVYWSQIFMIPAKVLDIIDVYCRNYIWSGVNTISKKALVAWEKVCSSKSAGGLNLMNLRIWVRAAVVKNCWDLVHKNDRLWIR